MPEVSTATLREQRRIRELSASVIRALSNNPYIHVRQNWFFDGNTPMVSYAPHIQLKETEGLEGIRGAADSLALRILNSDPELHRRNLPTDPIARLIFDWLESVRSESLTPKSFPGIKHNLIKRFYEWSAGFNNADHTKTELGILLYTVAQMCWSRIMGAPVFPETEDLIEATRASISPVIGHLLYELKKTVNDQREFSKVALEVAMFVAGSVEHAKTGKNKSSLHDNEEAIDEFALLLDFDFNDEGIPTAASQSISPTLTANNGSYRVFSKEFDKEIYPVENIRPELIKDYRNTINDLQDKQHVQFNLLVQRVRQALVSWTNPQWDWDQEEGLIDGRRLSQIVSSPTERRLFRKVFTAPVNDCCVSFLIDCSGSMKGYAQTVTMMVDLLVRAIELSGAKTEVLGYSTASWNGGRPYRKWLATGRKHGPGRLNEVEHRIFKNADSSWNKSNSGIMALMKLDTYREGIDGEAVEWACNRLLNIDSRRKILFVISDGSPMDSATNIANDENYLTAHLMAMLERYAKRGIEITGIGIGLDLSQIYRHSLIADFDNGLDNHFLNDFIKSLMSKPAYSN